MREVNNLTLVVNLSLRSIRTIIFDNNGKKIYEDWLPVQTYINGSSVEQDPNEWWELLVELLQKIFSNKLFAKKINYMTVTSSALCLVMLDKNGAVVEKSFMVSDKRAVVESQLLREKFSNFFKQNKTVKAEPSYMLPKILWLKYNNPSIFAKTKLFLSANDFLIYKLTGKIITDTLNAEKFYYAQNKYPSDILTFIGVSKENFPEVVHPGTSIGQLDREIKNSFSIQSSVEVVVSTYDAICALIGGNRHQEGELSNVCGTCSSYRIFSKKSFDQDSLVSQVLPGEDLIIIGGSNNLEGGVIEWAKECFYGDSYLKDDAFLYGLMEKEAKESELGANGIMFIPYLLGERMPFADANVRGMLFGIERYHTRRDIIRSVFESIGFCAKLVLEEFEQNGFPISSITMSGGVAKIPLAAQIRADIFGLPVMVLKEIETTALGAFILALKARNKIKSVTQAQHLIIVEKQYLPNMHNNNCYASLFMLYKDLYIENKSLFQKRRETFEKISHYRRKVLENL